MPYSLKILKEILGYIVILSLVRQSEICPPTAKAKLPKALVNCGHCFLLYPMYHSAWRWIGLLFGTHCNIQTILFPTIKKTQLL